MGILAVPHHHPINLPGVADNLQMVRFQQHQVGGALSLLDGAELLQFTEIQGWVVSGCGNCELQEMIS